MINIESHNFEDALDKMRQIEEEVALTISSAAFKLLEKGEGEIVVLKSTPFSFDLVLKCQLPTTKVGGLE